MISVKMLGKYLYRECLVTAGHHLVRQNQHEQYVSATEEAAVSVEY